MISKVACHGIPDQSLIRAFSNFLRGVRCRKKLQIIKNLCHHLTSLLLRVCNHGRIEMCRHVTALLLSSRAQIQVKKGASCDHIVSCIIALVQDTVTHQPLTLQPGVYYVTKESCGESMHEMKLVQEFLHFCSDTRTLAKIGSSLDL